MYLLAFKNNDEREELYNGAVGGNLRILVEIFSFDQAPGGCEREKKQGEEKKCPTHKNKTKKVCFMCVFGAFLTNTTLCVLSL